MKRVVAWMLRPVLWWLASSTVIHRGIAEDETGLHEFLVLGGLGLTFTWPRSSEELRDRAWEWIGIADQYENAGVREEC